MQCAKNEKGDPLGPVAGVGGTPHLVLKSQNLIRSPGFGLCYGFGSGSGSDSGSGFGLVFGFDVGFCFGVRFGFGFGFGFGSVLGLGFGFVVGSRRCSICIPPFRVVGINTQKTKKRTPGPGVGDWGPYLTP